MLGDASNPQWRQYTDIIDGVFAAPRRACHTLNGVLAALNASPTDESHQVFDQHPEFAALLRFFMRHVPPREAEHTVSQLYNYVVRRHAVRACEIDHTRAMRKMLRDL